MSQPSQGELEWIQMRKHLLNEELETPKEKFIRKFKQSPLVPIGCLATAAALCFGLYSFRVGEKRMSQMMMRTRIAAQGLTVAALVVGVAMSYNQNTQDKKDN